MTQQRGRKYPISRFILLLAIGLMLSLTIAFAATYRGKQTGGKFGIFKQPNGGNWFVHVFKGPGFRRFEAIYARNLDDGGDDRIQVYNNNHIVNFISGDRETLHIFGDWGEPPVLPSRISSRLSPNPIEPAPISLENLGDRPPVVEKNWQSYLEKLEAGWPMRCLTAEVIGPKIDNTYVLESVYRGAARRPNLVKGFPDTSVMFGRLRGAIPYHPMPLGLAANSVFWAIVLWAIVFMPRQLRRWWRVRHGRCLACGYDLSGAVSPICPECGDELTTSQV